MIKMVNLYYAYFTAIKKLLYPFKICFIVKGLPWDLAQTITHVKVNWPNMYNG